HWAFGLWIGCAAACATSFSSVVGDEVALFLMPQYAYRGERTLVNAQFLDLPAALVVHSRVTGIDFGSRVFVTSIDVNEFDGSLSIVLRPDPTAEVGKRHVRIVLDAGDGSQIVATAEFFVLDRPSP